MEASVPLATLDLWLRISHLVSSLMRCMTLVEVQVRYSECRSIGLISPDGVKSLVTTGINIYPLVEAEFLILQRQGCMYPTLAHFTPTVVRVWVLDWATLIPPPQR